MNAQAHRHLSTITNLNIETDANKFTDILRICITIQCNSRGEFRAIKKYV